MSPVDPRLERHRPALVYDPQEPYRAILAASITDYPGNTLQRGNGSVLSRAGSGLSLALLTRYEVRSGDRLDEAGDPLPAARRFQSDPAYAERVYGRVRQQGDRVWLQYWLWSYYNPKHLLGLGRHEGDWELVQIRLGAGGAPEAATYSQHTNGEARDWSRLERFENDHPVVYVAPLSHALYYEPGAHPYVLGVDNPDGSLPPVLPRVESFGDWHRWIGRWGASTGVFGGRFGGRSPASPGRQGQKWDDPEAWHNRARAAAPLRRGRVVVKQAGRATYPRLTALAARRADDRLLVDWAVDPARQRRATQLMVTLHREGRERELLASTVVPIAGDSGTAAVPVPAEAEGAIVVRASVYNALRQRSDPREVTIA
jgi:Vacuolar protein sorting-associated protein 62